MARPARRRDDAPRRRRRRPPFDGGSQYVEEEAGDRPGRVRGPGLLVVTVLAVLSLLMPVLWGIGQIEAIGRFLSDAALIGLWVVWGIVVVLFGWSLWSLWRRAA